jgi:hypothetical protein
MHRFILYASLILFLGHSATAQTEKNKKVGLAPRTDYREYYKKVNLAELAICDSNFTDANKYYAEAFSINGRKAFYKDMINAFHSAMDSKEYDLAEKYLSQLLQRGLDSEMEAGLKSGYMGENVTRLYYMFKRHHNNIDKVKNDPLTKKLKSMVDWDQGVREYYSRLYDGDYMVDSTYAVDVMNAKQLLRMLKEKGLPNEAIADETDYGIIILHNTGMGDGSWRYNVFDTLLYKGVLSFDYDVRNFATTVENNVLHHSFKYGDLNLGFPLTLMGCQLQFHGKRYLECYDDTSEARINKERAKIGLESLADLRKKMNAYNAGLDYHSYLHKYSLTSSMTVRVAMDEGQLEDWLYTQGEKAKVKKPYDFRAMERVVDMGKINGWILDTTVFDSLRATYHKWLKEYDLGQIYFSNWIRGRAPLKWNSRAIVVNNPNENLTTEAGRYNRAKLPNGYKYIVDEGADGWIEMKDIEMLFDSTGLLIYFKCHGGRFYSSVMVTYCGAATSVTNNHKKIPWPQDPHYTITLTSKQYTWVKDNLKTIVTTADELDEKNNVKSTTTYEMMDAVKYQAYLDKVNAEKRRLDEEYARNNTRN